MDTASLTGPANRKWLLVNYLGSTSGKEALCFQFSNWSFFALFPNWAVFWTLSIVHECYRVLLLFCNKCILSCSAVSDSLTPWTAAHQAPLSMGFFRQDYPSGLPCPTPGDLPYPGIEPTSPTSPPLAGRFFTTEPPVKLSEVPLLSKVPKPYLTVYFWWFFQKLTCWFSC